MLSARLATAHMQRQAGVMNVEATPADAVGFWVNAVDGLLALRAGHDFFASSLARCSDPSA